METYLIPDDLKPRSVGDRYMLEQIRLMQEISDKLSKVLAKEDISEEPVKPVVKRKKKEVV